MTRMSEIKTLEIPKESSECLIEKINRKLENLLKLILENSLDTVKNSEYFRLFDNAKEKKEITKVLSDFSLNSWCKILLCCIQCRAKPFLTNYVVDWLIFLILGLRHDGDWDREAIEKEWEDDKRLNDDNLSSFDISLIIKAITQNFLYEVPLVLVALNKTFGWINQEKASFVLKHDCNLRLNSYCQVIHTILTSYGVNECDKTLLKHIFLIQQKYFTKNRNVYEGDACLRISDLLVTRNTLSGKIQCRPLSLHYRESSESHVHLTNIQTTYLNNEMNLKQFLPFCLKTEEMASNISSTILFSLHDIQDHVTVSQPLIPHNCIVLLPLIARLLCIQNISCQISSIQSFDFLVTYTPFPFVSKLFDSLVTILKKCYPFFLTSTHDIKETVGYFDLYVKAWITLLSLPFDSSFHLFLNSCLDFLFSRFLINIIAFPDRLIPVLKHFNRFIQQKPFLSVYFVKELFLITLQAMESDHYHLCVISTQLIQTLVRFLPRFCTQLYWKDICVRIVILRSRIDDVSLIDNTRESDHMQLISKLSFLLHQLIEEMKKKLNTKFPLDTTTESQALEKEM